MIPLESGTADDYRQRAEQWLQDYVRRFTPFNDATIIGLELQVPIALDERGQYQMIGYIDRLARTAEGVWQIHDYKTNSRLPTQAEQDRQTQLAYYEIGIRQMWPAIERVELVWHFLRFDQTIRSTRTPDQLKEVCDAAIATIDDIHGRGCDEREFPTRESKLCGYCEYQSLCPVRKHLVAVQELPPNRFLAEPGVQLVDRWCELKSRQDTLTAEMKALEEEIAEIKEALTAVAARDGLQTVVGSEKEVSVAVQSKVMFPRKGQEPQQAAELETRLRDSPWWSQVSTLDRAALGKLWEERAKQTTELRDALEELSWLEEQVTLRLRNRQY